MMTGPLVSVGMPVYNRPEGLRRSLSCIAGQSYRHIEIIVSDNASPGDEVREVVREFMRNDPRITYVRQDKALRMQDNFKFVLSHASGEFFMWAADDDEWADGFIEQCLQALLAGNGVSVMSHFETLYRHDGRREPGRMPELRFDHRPATNAALFLACLTPSMFYGLHRRDSLGFILDDEFFDFYDCYAILRLILSGRVSIIEPSLYTAGVDAPSYQLKAVKKYRFTKLRYSPFLVYSLRLLASASLGVAEKLLLGAKILQVVVSMFLFHEVKRVLK